MSRLEAQMIEPIRDLMLQSMSVGIAVSEFRAGYGVPDLVGAVLCRRSCQARMRMGVRHALDHPYLVEVLFALRKGSRMARCDLLGKVTMSESTLRNRVLPRLCSYGLIEHDADGRVRLLAVPPQPTRSLVAVEAKQTRWLDAILQARRYTFFADRSYVAVWSDVVPRVDRGLLYRHRLGLIEVEDDRASVVVEAPARRPREPQMNRYCSEYLYGLALEEGVY